MSGVAPRLESKNARDFVPGVQATLRSSPSPAVPQENSNPTKQLFQISRGSGQSPAAENSRFSAGFEEVMRLNTGWKQSPDNWVKARQRQDVLARQTEEIAACLEKAGIQARLSEGSVADLAAVTDQIATRENYRSICFLPVIAQRERRPILNALRYFQCNDLSASKYVRYAVVTAGQRVPMGGDLRKRAQWLTRQISRWASEAAKEFGVELIFRGTEFTIDKALTFHVHANVLYVPRRKLTKGRWGEFLSWSKLRLGGVHWKDCGRLKEPDEAIKYPFKPAELGRVSNDPEALAWLFKETYRLKIAQPLSRFAEFRRGLEADRRKVVIVNRGGTASLEIVSKSQRSDDETPSLYGGEGENVILCRTLPCFQFGLYAEPAIKVLNFTASPTTPDGARRLALINGLKERARALWDANGAPAPELALRETQDAIAGCYNVHTCRSTVHETGEADTPTDYPPPETHSKPAAEHFPTAKNHPEPKRPSPIQPTVTLPCRSVIDPWTGEVLFAADYQQRNDTENEQLKAYGEVQLAFARAENYRANEEKTKLYWRVMSQKRWSRLGPDPTSCSGQR